MVAPGLAPTITLNTLNVVQSACVFFPLTIITLHTDYICTFLKFTFSAVSSWILDLGWCWKAFKHLPPLCTVFGLGPIFELCARVGLQATFVHHVDTE